MMTYEVQELTERAGELSRTWTVEKRDGFTTIWHSEPPAFGSWYTVIDDEWDGMVRHIHEWKQIQRA